MKSRKFSKYPFFFSTIFLSIVFAVAFLFISTVNSLASTQVSLEWAPNTESDLAGYRVFTREEGKSYDYTNPSWEGATNYCTIYNIDETKNYYYVVRAFNISGIESDDSNEVCLYGIGLVREAEAGKLFGFFEVASDPGASNGQYVHVPNGTGNRVDGPDEAHKIEYTFNVPEAGIYRIKGWVHGEDGGEDSFWVKVNGSPSEGYLWDTFQNTSYQEDYVMDRVGDWVVDRSNSEVVEVMLEAGINVVTIYLREDGTRLDKIELEYLESASATINQPPTAIITQDYIEPSPGMTVTLDGSKSTDTDDGIASCSWTQVEGTPVTLFDHNSELSSFIAPETDQYGSNLTFQLTVTDFGGLQSTAICLVYVSPNESNNPPVAYFSYDYGKKAASFNDLSNDDDGTIVSWFWDFGDGETSTEQNPEHRYTKFGVYSVTLTVTDNDEASQSISQDINVSH